jgi:hypothetical protein
VITICKFFPYSVIGCSASFSQHFLQPLPRLSLKIAPKALLQICTNASNRCVIFFTRIGGVGSFTGDFVARHNKTYTLFPFTHSNLRHPLPANL